LASWDGVDEAFGPLWPLRVSCCINLLYPTVGEGMVRRCKQSSGTDLSTSMSSDNWRWSTANVVKDNKPLVLEVAIFLAIKS